MIRLRKRKHKTIDEMSDQELQNLSNHINAFQDGGGVFDKMTDNEQINSDKYFTRVSKSGRMFKYKKYLN